MLLHIGAYVFVYVCVQVCAVVFVCVCASAQACVCMYMRICVCVCARVCARVRVRVRVRARMRATVACAQLCGWELHIDAFPIFTPANLLNLSDQTMKHCYVSSSGYRNDMIYRLNLPYENFVYI